MLTINCPWCKKKGDRLPQASTFAEAEAHLRGHGATDEQIAQARQAFQDEVRCIQYESQMALYDTI